MLSTMRSVFLLACPSFSDLFFAAVSFCLIQHCISSFTLTAKCDAGTYFCAASAAGSLQAHIYYRLDRKGAGIGGLQLVFGHCIAFRPCLPLRGGGGAEEKIAEVEKEMRRTQKNKGTEAHLGHLKARLSKLRKAVAEASGAPSRTAGHGKSPHLSNQGGHGLSVLQTNASTPCDVDHGVPTQRRAREQDKEEVESQQQVDRVSESAKTRMSLLDLVVQASNLNASLGGMRLSNIYDFDGKTIVLKLGGSSSWPAHTPHQTEAQQPEQEDSGGFENGGGSGEAAALASISTPFNSDSRRAMVVIESGVRIHSTAYTYESPPQPSAFVMKLRKHLRNQRLTQVHMRQYWYFCTSTASKAALACIPTATGAGGRRRPRHGTQVRLGQLDPSPPRRVLRGWQHRALRLPSAHPLCAARLQQP